MSTKISIRVLFWSVLALASVLVILGVNSATAQNDATGNGFRITPLRHELTIERGQTDVVTLNLQNITAAPLIATPGINDFVSDDASGQPVIITDPNDVQPTSIKPFITNLDSYSLEPGESVDIQVPVVIPENAAPGSYYGILRYSASPSKGAQGDTTEISLAASIGSLVFISVPGDTIELATVENITAVKDGSTGSLFSSAPNEIAITIANKGNTFIKVFGDVVVRGWSGNEVYSYQLNPEPRGITLPDSNRTFTNSIEGVGGFGRYTIEANVAYGEGSVVTVQTQFWVVPWAKLLTGLAIFIGLIFLATRGVKAYNRKIVSSAKKTNL